MTHLASCSKLTSLTVFECPQLIGLRNLSSVVNLELFYSSATDLSMLAQCKNLKILRISGCKKLISLVGINSCIGLINIQIESCPKLKDISPLQGCTSLTSFATESSPLINIKGLSGCTSLINVDIYSVSNRDYTFLQKLPCISNITINGTTLGYIDWDFDREINWDIKKRVLVLQYTCIYTSITTLTLYTNNLIYFLKI